ncbi:MAG: UDP-N-acetylmuramoyl-L-alanine--D-glutamate ligase [Saprospiraceae bacterium]|nr:UDP-N-acetylmuramoyl-L-alanine--D-glutamate ligase [Bacteroidia bacterium]NNL91645.1 UDP-N-acetylmuramoyl-L-alanine--D-glutamate ligase [Saprospiraceae bacterium]
MRSITVLGAGESGIGAALLAKAKGINVWVSDYGKIEEKYKNELLEHKIPFEEKGHNFDIIDNTELIVKSPGIPEKSNVVQHFRLRNKRIISEIEFAFEFYSGKIAAITGSNGKTTTTSLTYEILRKSNLKVGLGGNIGYSFSRLLTNDLEYDWVVLELSSFQLEDLYDFKADISVILNITPDHLDRYDYDFNKYAKAKWKLAEHTKKDGYLLLNNDDPTLKHFAIENPVDANIVWLSANNPTALVSKETNQKFEINLLGIHNIYNASVGKSIAEIIGLKPPEIASGLLSFKSIEHRLETVSTFNEVRYVNDSKATNVESAEVALKSFEPNIIWIAGGTDKGNDYTILEKLVFEKVVAIICLCVDDEKLRSAFANSECQFYTTQSVDDALEKATAFAKPGDTVLLSPACASFDLFDNYIHRGNEFKNAVHKLINEIN